MVKAKVGVSREEYLRYCYTLIRARLLPEAPAEVPPIAWGFPSARATSKRNRTIGQIWHGAGVRNLPEERAIFVSPTISEGIERILGVLLHEMVHAALPVGVGHREPFAKLARRCGLTSPWTATNESKELTEQLKQIAADANRKVGEWPGGYLVPTPKDSCRMLKAQCHCGRVLRLSRKVAEQGAINCGVCDSEFVVEE